MPMREGTHQFTVVGGVALENLVEPRSDPFDQVCAVGQDPGVDEQIAQPG